MTTLSHAQQRRRTKRAWLDKSDAATLIPRSVIMTKRRMAVAFLILAVGLPAAATRPAPSNAAAAERAAAPVQAEEPLPAALRSDRTRPAGRCVFMVVCCAWRWP